MWALLEINLAGRAYTWGNNQENQVMCRLDRVFCTTHFDSAFPLANIRALARIRSDHTPIVWDSGETRPPKKGSFKFEKWWLVIPEFKDIVLKAWSLDGNFYSVLDKWQAKVRYLRKLAKGWSANFEAVVRKQKKALMEEYDLLDIKSESLILSAVEMSRFNFILNDLKSFWIMEETKAKQRSREKFILEGDRNTAYFHAVANQRRRKKMIRVLDGPDGPVTETKEMLGIAMDYYKDLFGFEDRPDIRLKHNFFSADERVKVDENEMLSRSFSEEEIREAVFSSYADGAPGPDGLSFMFYQTFWDVVKKDLIDMFNAWHEDKLDLFRLNFTMITLIPKENEARSMRKFRPISLLNCSFKIFTKVLTNRLARIINRLISFHQSAFIRGRYILESVVTAHEIIHEVHRKKDQGLVFKIDYEKAYDKVNLEFLFEVLELRGLALCLLE
jgi:hypothetical protein